MRYFFLLLQIFTERVDRRGREEGDAPTATMGVASPSTKRRLGVPEGEHAVVAAKLAKIAMNNNNELPMTPTAPTPEDSIAVTTDFLTTSILARTLLTSSVHGPEPAMDPLESLKSTLEALPAPNESLLTPFLKSTIADAENDEFTALLCPEPSLTPVAVVNGLPALDSSSGKIHERTNEVGALIKD